MIPSRPRTSLRQCATAACTTAVALCACRRARAHTASRPSSTPQSAPAPPRAMGWPWPVALLGYLTSSATATLVLSAASSVLAAACWAAYTALSLLVRRLDEDAAVARTHLLEDPYSAKRIPAPSIHSEPSKSLTVVFPAFNEGARMEPAIEEALEHLAVQRKATPGFSYEVILVDDGSKDDTYQQAMKFVERLGLDTFRVIHFPVNRGKGAAVRAGALAARGELVLFADADGATQFSDLERLRARMGEIASEAGASESRGLFSGIADRQGVVAGSRAHLETTDAVTQREWYRQVLMHGFHFLVTLVAGKRIRDTQCGFKLFTRRSARLLFSNLRLQRWCFDVELVYLAQRLRIPLVEESVTWDEVAGTKIQWWAPLSMARDLLLVKVAYGSGAWVARADEAAQ